MRILALQLKRIGDLILSAPALAAVRAALPECHLALAAFGPAAELLPAFPSISTGIVFGPGRGWTPWQQVLTGSFETVLDFTGSDRSAAATALSRANLRAAFGSLQRSTWKRLAYNRFVESPVREAHTEDHYLALAAGAFPDAKAAPHPAWQIPARARADAARLLEAQGIREAFVIVHPGTARTEKNWQPARWAEVIAHLLQETSLSVVVTGGADPQESAHLAALASALPATEAPARRGRLVFLNGQTSLLALAALAGQAALVLSCDTAIVHLAAAAGTPQLALFGPTNPFHWRPRHARASVLSATQPETPLTTFEPRLPGAPMERISTAAVIRATDALLSPPRPTSITHADAL